MKGKVIKERKKTADSKGINAKTTNMPSLLVQNNKDYNKVMARIDELIEIPDDELTKELANELKALAKAAQQFEQQIYTIKPPTTFEGILEMKMYELKLNQGGMAKKLKISDAKFSLILSGKQAPDIKLLKTMHDNLGLDGNYLLSVF